jgi:aminotransferase
VIRRASLLCHSHGAVNLAQAFPDYDAGPAAKEAGMAGIRDGYNQYTHTYGLPALREKLAQVYGKRYGIDLDPERNVLITCGCMEALRVLINTIVRTGGLGTRFGVVEPFYESFPIQVRLEGGEPIFLSLDPHTYRFDPAQLARLDGQGAAALLVNSPNNPCGMVLNEHEMAAIHDYCRRNDLLLISDETYEHVVFDGRRHRSFVEVDRELEHTVIVSGFGKTFSITGWRVGYIIGSAAVLDAVKPSHDYNTVCAPAPLQHGCLRLLELGDDYYAELAASYQRRREVLLAGLQDSGFTCSSPEGAYYILVDTRELRAAGGFATWQELVYDYLIGKVGVGGVPGGAFFHDAERAENTVRFTFSKSMPTIEQAVERLGRVRQEFLR